jgi:hypothetical protein
MAEQRYLVTRSFWQWCYAHEITAVELARVTGYSASLVKHVRLHGTWRTVSQQFVDRVATNFVLPEDAHFFDAVSYHLPRVNGRFAPRQRPKQTLGR